EPDAALNARAERRLAKSSREVTVHALSAEQLPFDAGSFDTVVSTFTLCSIPDVASALREIHRVLKPGGQFLFLEHSLSPEEGIARWQHRLTPLQKVIGGGCHLDRPIRSLIEHAGLQVQASGYEERYAPKLPKILCHCLSVRWGWCSATSARVRSMPSKQSSLHPSSTQLISRTSLAFCH
ncbi:MAG: class I SAM-dependent methyltransferase, partial [Acidibacter sp.]|nr:class I SAM-dependent methyltransferase [Acidibacter sp.]